MITAKQELIDILIKHAQAEGDHATVIPELMLYRRNTPTQPLPCIYDLSLVVIAQGTKRITMGEAVLNATAGHTMLTTVHLPVVSHVTRATPDKPFLALLLLLDHALILEMASEMNLTGGPEQSAFPAISHEQLDSSLGDACLRLIQLTQQPKLASFLAPVIRKEIIIRLLTGPHSAHLLSLVESGSPDAQIADVITWLKQNFTQGFGIDHLAERACMSPSTFRRHFRTMTGTSPLQYQKKLRLQEARQLMLDRGIDAGYAGGLVGYESASQFSREYRRLFGAPPKQDVEQIRQSKCKGGVSQSR